MDQEKIGRFISQLRKERNMTQMELANKLGITDRAISKWENGRGLPDLSLIKPLCQILNISINELLSGERLDNKDYQEKSEEIIINTINYTDKKLKNTKKNFKIILLIILLLLVISITLFSIDINRMRNNKPVFFSTWGFDYTPPVNLSTDNIENTIYSFLLTNNNSQNKHYDNENWFISFKTFLIEEINSKSKYNVYAWVLEESYYLENDVIKEGSKASIPYKFVIEVINNNYIVTDYKVPRDGNLYTQDMKILFPLKVRLDMNKVYTDGTIESLHSDIQKQINLYYHK